MPVGQLNDRYWFLKNLRRHRERLGDMKAETDSSAPKLPVDPRNDKRKVPICAMNHASQIEASLKLTPRTLLGWSRSAACSEDQQ